MFRAMDPHHLAEARSLAYHRVVAARLRDDPRLLDLARENVARWLPAAGRGEPVLRRWQAILARPLDEIGALLVDPGPDACELRHASPFAGALDPRERWRIWREVRATHEQVA